MKIIVLILALFFFDACAIKYKNIHSTVQDKDVRKLTKMLTKLDKSIDKQEALDLALFSTSYTKHLANKYGLVISPNFQNFLVNIGVKKKGYCYNYADDLGSALLKRGYKTFDIYRMIHKRGTIFEHNSIMITPLWTNKKGVILDGWRNAGTLYFSRKKDDTDYDWRFFKKLTN